MAIKPQIRHYGKVMNMRLTFHNKALWYQQLGALEGQEFELVIKKRHKPVTNDQYSFYYGGILTTCFESEIFSAFDKAADIHAYFEDKFLSFTSMIIVGDVHKEIIRHRSLTTLNKTEMSEFIEKTIIHCINDLDIEILSPELYYTNLYKTKTK